MRRSVMMWRGLACVGVLGGSLTAGSLVAGAAQAARSEQEARENAERAARRDAFKAKLITEYDTSDARIDLGKLLAPGVARDGIPALTNPKRIAAKDAPYPTAEGRVAEVEINGEAVAYPLGILNFHEIANDVVGGVPIAATYCPLCDSVSVIDRRLTVNGETKTLEFGVSGFLYNSNVVMYERTTMGLWSQVLMEAVTGPHAGMALAHLPVRVERFSTFLERHPEGQVLSTETGHERPYERNPYEEYFKSDRVYMEFEHDDRLPAKTLGMGVRAGATTVFVPWDAASRSPVRVRSELGEIVVGADEAGMWVDGLPEGAQAVQTFYHSWAGFHPGTAIARGEDGEKGR